MPSNFEMLLHHNLWANLQLVEFWSMLPGAQLDGAATGTFGPPRETLVHIVANEYGYLRALEHELDGALPHGTSFPGFDALHEHMRRSGEALVSAASSAPEGKIVRGEFQGRPYEMLAAFPLMQAINHGTEHRAQIAVSLTQAGAIPPVLDVWTYAATLG